MPNREVIDLLAICRIKHVSWYLVAREASRPGGIARLLAGEVTEKSREATLAREAIGSATHLDTLREESEREIASAARDGFRVTTVLDPDYPLNLRTIFNLSPFLFYRGSLDAESDARSVAVVGTREASPEGMKLSAKMSRLLVEQKITVLSGLARGVDTAAHTAALDSDGRTIAVLGSGLRRVYPKENRALAERIAEQGAVVSQFWLDAPPATYSFPRRNVTMSGMGQGTVVIEASSTSGAKMQARLALEHGKQVFLIRRLVTQQAWAQSYLKRGAIEVSDVQDIAARLRSADEIRSRTRMARQLSLSLS
ncbi:MAG: DNA-processing protein DprA [Candidatus Binataceae bacterium]